MRKEFICSLCHNGILGGDLYLDEQSLTYRTQKLTLDNIYWNLVMPLQNIRSIVWKHFFFPIATLTMKSGKQFTFLIFNRRRFQKCFDEVKANL